MDRGVQSPVMLVSGHAGVGKTVLLTSWVDSRRAPGPVAWVTLEPGNRDPSRFWILMLEALHEAHAVSRRACTALQARLDVENASFVDHLAAVLKGLQHPVVVVLDDFDVSSAPQLLEGVDELIRHRVEQLRLVISSRVDPALPQLPRIRLREDLVELRAADLAFTDAEAVELLGGHGVSLEDKDLALLQERTEGWAAGLRLAAIWLQDRSEPDRAVAAFAGTDRTVADYLVTEVLDQQPPELRDFLLSTSVVKQFSGGLANTLTGRVDGEQLLVSLERSNAFVIPVDSGRTWYRYHPLFAELLQFELKARAPKRVVLLHGRAARWLACHGSPVEAVRHALDAGDWAYAVTLLVRFGLDMALRGDAAVMCQLVERLPGDVVRANPVLDILVALHRFEALDREAASRYLTRSLGSHVPAGGQDQERYVFLTAFFEVIAASRAGRLERVLEVAPDVLALQAGNREPSSGGVTEADAVRSVTLLHVGAAEAWVGQFDAAEAHLVEATDQAGRSGLEPVEVEGLALLALLHVMRGHLELAYTTGQSVLALADRLGLSASDYAGQARFALTWVSLEWNDIAAAARYVEQVGASRPPHWQPAALGFAVLRSRLCQRWAVPTRA